MKKFTVFVLILLIFAGFLFYVGCPQIKLKPDNYGIIVSKTSGLDKDIIKPGKPVWKKEFLLPTNAELKQFKIEPVTIETTITGQLPSGDLYTSIYSSSNNFSYSLTYSISVTVSPESIISLYELNQITDNESLQKYLETAAKTIAQLSTNYILTKAKDTPGFRVEQARREDIIRSIQFYTDYPEVELFALAITDSKIPDFNLYSQLQDQFILNQDKYFSAEQNKAAKNNNETQNKSEDSTSDSSVELNF